MFDMSRLIVQCTNIPHYPKPWIYCLNFTSVCAMCETMN